MATTTTSVIALTTNGLSVAPVEYFSPAVAVPPFAVELSLTCIISLVPRDTTYTWGGWDFRRKVLVFGVR